MAIKPKKPFGKTGMRETEARKRKSGYAKKKRNARKNMYRSQHKAS